MRRPFFTNPYCLHCLPCQAPVFLLLIDPGGEGLLDDPPVQPLQPFGKLVDLLGERQRHVGGQHLGFHAGPSGQPNLTHCQAV